MDMITLRLGGIVDPIHEQINSQLGTNYSWLTFSKEQEQSYAIDKRIMNGKISEKQALPFRQDLIDKIHKCIENSTPLVACI